LRNVRYKTW